MGASPIKPPLLGLDLSGLFSLRTVEDVDRIEAWIESHPINNVVSAGGGFIGLEVAEQFERRGFNVTVIDANPQVLKPLDPEMANLVQDELERNGIELMLNAPRREVC